MTAAVCPPRDRRGQTAVTGAVTLKTACHRDRRGNATRIVRADSDYYSITIERDSGCASPTRTMERDLGDSGYGAQFRLWNATRMVSDACLESATVI